MGERVCGWEGDILWGVYETMCGHNRMRGCIYMIG